MIIINHPLIREQKLQQIQEITDYIPLALMTYADENYFKNATETAKNEYYLKRTQLQGASNKAEFLEDDLMNWINENPQFQDIIIWQD